MCAHSHTNEITKLAQGDPLAYQAFSCENKDPQDPQGPQIPECYTCARVLHHQIPSILTAIDELFERTGATATATTDTPSSSSSSLPNEHQSRFQGLQYAPALERALLEGHNEQSSIIAFGVEVGDLSLSPQRNERRFETD